MCECVDTTHAVDRALGRQGDDDEATADDGRRQDGLYNGRRRRD